MDQIQNAELLIGLSDKGGKNFEPLIAKIGNEYFKIIDGKLEKLDVR